MKWTKKNLSTKLMAVLRRGSTTIKFMPLNSKKEVANSQWRTSGQLWINIDPFQCATLDGVIHELLHFTFRKTHGELMDYSVEEPQIQALEAELVKHVRSDSLLFHKWKKLINEKLGRKQ